MRRRNKTDGKAAKRRRHKTLRHAPKVTRRDEALGQQAATAEVLKIISSSRGQLEPVFQAILANAVRICEAKFGVLYPYENGIFRPSAEFGVPPALSNFIKQRGPFQPRPKTTLERLIQTKQVIYCADILAEDTTNPMAKFGSARTYRDPVAQRSPTGRHHHHLSSGSPPVYRHAYRTAHNLSRQSRHRDRERTAAQRAATAHERSFGSTTAADCDSRCIPGDRKFNR